MIKRSFYRRLRIIEEIWNEGKCRREGRRVFFVIFIYKMVFLRVYEDLVYFLILIMSRNNSLFF